MLAVGEKERQGNGHRSGRSRTELLWKWGALGLLTRRIEFAHSLPSLDFDTADYRGEVALKLLKSAYAATKETPQLLD